MRITFLNQKGGVGKSTVLVALGAVLDQAGYRVAIDDRDPQKSATFWAREVGKLSLFDASSDFDVVLTDTPGHLDLANETSVSLLAKLVADSDRIVIVAERSLFSIHATTPMVRLIHARRRDDARVFLLLNKTRPVRSKTWADTEREIAYRLGVPLLGWSIPFSISFEHMQTKGLKALRQGHLETVLRIALELMR
jgi:cellulose biosynthesis protein BcsQ